MRKLTTGLLIAASALAVAGCGKTEEAPAASTEATAEATEAATAAASEGADADAASTEAGDPNNNPIRP
jgi:Flp pilus assembly protein TadD